MLRIVVDDVTTPVGENVVIPQDVVDGALQLRELYADLDMLRYDGIRGLGFQDTRGWQAWFGAGTNMLAKVNVYNALVDSLLARNIHPEYIDIGNVDAPYYKIWWQQEAEQAPTEVDS
jgi:hypothetical protein